MLDKLLKNFEDPVMLYRMNTQKTEELSAIYSYFAVLTNNRRFGNKLPVRLEQVIDGYNKMFTLINRFNKQNAM